MEKIVWATPRICLVPRQIPLKLITENHGTWLKLNPTLRSQVPPVTGAPVLAWSTPSRPWPAPQEGTMEEAATTVTTTTRSRWQSSWNNSGKSRKKSKSTHKNNNGKRSELRSLRTGHNNPIMNGEFYSIIVLFVQYVTLKSWLFFYFACVFHVDWTQMDCWSYTDKIRLTVKRNFSPKHNQGTCKFGPVDLWPQ